MRPAWQGRGIGGALLRAAFQALRAGGATQVALAVQLGVAVEALDLYRRAGMTEVRRIEFFEKTIGRPALGSTLGGAARPGRPPAAPRSGIMLATGPGRRYSEQSPAAKEGPHHPHHPREAQWTRAGPQQTR